MTSERPYTNARVSKDGRWHVVVDTPSVIATPDGSISIAWGGTDEKYRLRAEAVASEIEDAMNRRALPAVATSPAPDTGDKLREAAGVPEIAALINAAGELTLEWAYDVERDHQYRVVNAGNEDWHNFIAALRAIAGGDA